MIAVSPGNRDLADGLERIGELLELQDAEAFRVRAYRAAADRLRELDEPAGAILDREGRAGLERLPDIGRSMSALVEEHARTGRIGLLERLEGRLSDGRALERVPGLGEVLAERIHRRLGIETLEELELAAHDGRLERVEGFGPRRVEGVKATLAGILGWRSRARRPARDGDPRPAPDVDVLLSVDEEYREKAEADELERIAPRRFNPDGRAWLPILHARRGDWHLTALFSNTALAHRLGRTDDWVVIFYERDGDEGQCTVVTERRGELEGWRVVRGRESECLEHYARRHGWSDGALRRLRESREARSERAEGGKT